jgi:hypothetical protein
MSQTKKQSFIEAISNTAVGFIVSYISTFLIFPLVGVATSAGTNLVIVFYFTVVSILRSYIIRRCFNKKTAKPNEFISFFCFECETHQISQTKGNHYHCNTCGLKHSNL